MRVFRVVLAPAFGSDSRSVTVTVQTGVITSVWAIIDLGVYLGDVSPHPFRHRTQSAHHCTLITVDRPVSDFSSSNVEFALIIMYPRNQPCDLQPLSR